jgi:2-polyprenyl-3-methyl-5-hydroxy-6-metoxy-1,4-benzoquinol methylase
MRTTTTAPPSVKVAERAAVGTPSLFDERFAMAKLDPKIERAELEARWIRSLLADAGPGDPQPRILDLGCGQGRVAIAMARTGAHVVGLDTNLAYLAEANRRASAASVAVDWRCGDDRELDTADQFDAVVSLFTSFGYHIDEDNATVVGNIARALAPGGLLVLETQNRDNPSVLAERVALELLPDGTELLKTYRFDPWSARKQMRFRYLRDGRVEDGGELSVRLYALHELAALCRSAGLAPVEVFGSSRGDAFDPVGEKMVLVARKEEA